jgi:cation transport protein ChaC
MLSDAEIADRLSAARGPFGSCMEYLTNTIEHLDAIGLRDAGLDRIRRCIVERPKGFEAGNGV